MNSILDNFIEKLKNDQKLQCEFTKCKSLKESYAKFMKGKCSYEEYENFFKDLMQKQIQLSDQDLEQIAGGNALGKIMLPITIFTVMTGASMLSASAAPTGNISASDTINKKNDENEDNKQQNIKQNNKHDGNKQKNTEKKNIDGIIYTAVKKTNTVVVFSKDDNQKNFSVQDIYKNLDYVPELCTIGFGIEHIDIGKDVTANLNLNNAKDLKSITVDPKNERYFADECALWEKDPSGNPKKLLKIFGDIKNTKNKLSKANLNGINCRIYLPIDKRTICRIQGDGKTDTLDISNIHENLNSVPDVYAIESGIKHVNIGKDATMDLNFNLTKDLKSITVDPKNERYFADKCTLWEKDPSGKPKKLLKIFGDAAKTTVELNGVMCTIFPHDKNGPSAVIEGNSQTKVLNIQDINEKLNHIIKHFTIDSGIEHVNIGQNDTMDLNFNNAKDLKSITVDPKNERYLADKCALWEKDSNGKPKKLLKIFADADKTTVELGGVMCTIFPHDKNGPSAVIEGNSQTKVLNIQDINEKLNNIIKKLTIKSKIEEVIIGKDATMDLNFNDAKDLKSISVDPQNKRYSTNGVSLYSTENAKKEDKKLIYSLNKGFVCSKRAEFNVNVLGQVTVSKTPNCEKGNVSLDLSIFDDIIKKYVFGKIKIGSGIEHIKLRNQDVDISKAYGLKSIDLDENSEKYKIVRANLWEVDAEGNPSTNLGLIDKTPIIEFCSDVIDRLPKLKQGKKFEDILEDIAKDEITEFKPYLALPNQNDLKNSKKYNIFHPNEERTGRDASPPTEITINEKEIYQKIQDVVQKLKDKVKNRTPKKGTPEKDIKAGIEEGIYSKNYEMNKHWRTAKAIYRWVAENISYDKDSLVDFCRASQDPLFVFARGAGVCEGYSRLINLMMRMAGIPSLNISTIKNQDSDTIVHAYNAIYLPDSSNKESGWVVFDSTWGSPNEDASQPNVIERGKKRGILKLDGTPKADLSDEEKEALKNKFPSFYSQNKNSKNDNREILKLLSHKIEYFDTITTDTITAQNEYFDDTSIFSIGDWTFRLCGSVQNPLLKVNAKKTNDQKRESIRISEIPKQILGYNLPIAFEGEVKTFILDTNDYVDLNFSGSIPYYINIDRKDIKCSIKGYMRRADAANQTLFSYAISDNFIRLSGKDIDIEKIPVGLKLISKQLKKPFMLKNCTGSLHLGKDDDVDLEFGKNFDVNSIKVDEKNKRYFADELALWEKNDKNEPEKLVYELKNISKAENNIAYPVKSSKPDKVKYLIGENFINLKGQNIDFNKLPVSLKLASKKFKKPFMIKNCTGSFKLGENDDFKLEFDDSFKPTSIEIHENNPRYEVRNNAVYDK